ncbi:hypothetical protein OR1_03054 [Geobacter sp. OR-1]|uniref:hypothetical protein n=1 Tax=Geobacter sp. OR-1 TaxID=1266765 RepID=UPI000541EF70|nr:hypothetical protein [Geobacter sp. OR-1]GAM10757.1 hypothetical protein OR1_03054 [Geobacter sp. OR-1]
MSDLIDLEKNMLEKRIEAILDERRQLRDELIMFQRALVGLGPILVTVWGGIFVAILGKDAPRFFQENRILILTFLNQLLFFLGLYVAMIVVNGQIHNRYIAHLENELNNLVGKPTCIWEISGDAFQPSFVVLTVVLILTLSGGFLALTSLTFGATQSHWLLILNINQLILVIGAFTYQFLWGDKRYDEKLKKTFS